LSKDAIFGIGESRDDIGHNVGELKRVIATPPKDATFSACEPKNTIENDSGKPAPSVATPPTDAIFSIGQHRDAVVHGVGILTPPQDAIFGRDELGIPLYMAFENSRQASRRLRKTPQLTHMSLRMPLKMKLKNDAERRYAAKRRHIQHM
jgi:hypothetical protein